jgi:hypothetical protein
MTQEPTQQPVGPLSAEVIQAHAEHDHLAAVFADREHAEAAIEELRSLGLGSEHLGVAVRSGDTVVFEHDTESEMLHDLEVGAAVGMPLGFLAGIALAALTVPGIAVGGLLAIASVGAGWGGFLGSYVGIGVGEKAANEHADIELLALRPGEVLVVVCGHGYPEQVLDTMRRHDGRIRELSRARG